MHHRHLFGVPIHRRMCKEFTTAGQFVCQFSIDVNNGGAFGVALQAIGSLAFRIAAVDDDQNVLRTWTEIVH
jgi:hypothetical protein